MYVVTGQQDRSFMMKREGVSHGDHLFPLKKYDVVLSESFPLVPAHWHEEAEFTWIRSGACVYHIDLCDYLVQEGDMILLPPRILHSSGFFPRDHMMSESFVFHLDFLGMGGSDVCSVKYLRPFASREIVFPYVFQADHPANPLLRDMMRQLSDEYISRGDGYELRMKALFLELFSRIWPYRLLKNPAPSSRDQSEKLKQVLDYIDAHLEDMIPVADLARICCFSESHFMRFFKLHVGMTCTEYINTLRLERAWKLLQSGQVSVIDAAFSSGFHNLSYFYRIFKKKYHMTPKEAFATVQSQ